MESIRIVELESIEPQVESQLAHLLQAVVEDGASIGFLPPLTQDEAHSYWSSVIEPGVKLWVALQGDRVVGTVQLHLAMKKNGLHRAEVAKLMVHPESRRQGIAGLLMNHMEQEAKALHRSLLVLDTRAGDPSNDLYKSLGYIEVGAIPNFALSASGSLNATVLYYKQL